MEEPFEGPALQNAVIVPGLKMSFIFPIGLSLDSIENVFPHLLSSVEKPRTYGLRNILQASQALWLLCYS